MKSTQSPKTKGKQKPRKESRVLKSSLSCRHFPDPGEFKQGF